MTGERVDDAQEWLLSVIARGERWAGHTRSVPAGAAESTSLVLKAAPESVREAREFARTSLAAWGLAAMYDDVGLVVSELVTNALRHAFAGPRGGAADGSIRLGLVRAGGRLTCAVSDPSDEVPVRADPGFSSQNGRGLHLVDAFSDSWSWAPLYDRGKVVWASFTIGPAR